MINTLRIMDRIVALHPERKSTRIFRAFIEVDRRADTGPWRAAIEKILTNEPGSAEDPICGEPCATSCFVRSRLGRRQHACGGAFPEALRSSGASSIGRDFWVGVVARLKGDETSARAAFMRARAQQEEEIRVHLMT